MPRNANVWNRLEAQGFCGLDDETLEELAGMVQHDELLHSVIHFQHRRQPAERTSGQGRA